MFSVRRKPKLENSLNQRKEGKKKERKNIIRLIDYTGKLERRGSKENK